MKYFNRSDLISEKQNFQGKRYIGLFQSFLLYFAQNGKKVS